MKRNNMILNSDRAFDGAVNIFLIIIGIVCLYPIWFVIIASVSSPNAIGLGQVFLLPKGLNFEGYTKLVQNKDIWIGYKNSLIYTACSLIADLFVQIPCAYALSRKELPLKKLFMIIFTIPLYFSGGIIPKYLLLSQLGMINKPISLILPSCISCFNLIVARSYFAGTIPDSLFEAAKLDGCGYLRYFIQIVLKLSGPIIAIIALYSLQTHWNSYLEPVMYLYDPSKYTLQQVLRSITASLVTSLNEFATLDELVKASQETELIKYSVVIVASLPMIAIYPMVQKHIVKGIMIGAIKG